MWLLNKSNVRRIETMKKIMVAALAAVLAVGLSSMANAQDNSRQGPGGPGWGRGTMMGTGWAQGMMGNGIAMRLMFDADGNLLDQDAFTGRLDKAIEDGIVQSGQRQWMLDTYQWYQAGGGFGGGSCCTAVAGGGWRR
jgi:hypothetical protein